MPRSKEKREELRKKRKSQPLDPRQVSFISNYTNPNSPTFSNALQSALKAGYKQEYAESIVTQMPDWLLESLGDGIRLKKAEKVLDKTLEDNYDEVAFIVDGKDLGVKVKNPKLSKIQQDSAKFVAERLGKKKYSVRTEVEGNMNVTFSLKALAEEADKRQKERLMAKNNAQN